MGEAATSIRPAEGGDAAGAAPSHGAVVCLCGKPIALVLAPTPSEKAEEKPFDPGPAIPPEIRAGLIEIHACIREERNPRGGRALCWDVLDQILDYGRQTWPLQAPHRAPDSSLREAAITASTVVATTGITVTLGWVTRLTDQMNAVFCGRCASADHMSVGAVLIAAVSMAASAALSVVVQRRRASRAFGGQGAGHGDASKPGAPRRMNRLKGLREQGVISQELFAWGGQVGLDEPPKPKPGEKPALSPPPPPAADHAGVRLLGAFVLALADQVFETPRKLNEARTGRWP